MASGSDEAGSGEELTPVERERLSALESAESLADLVDITGIDSEHRAYFRAKAEWRDLRSRALAGRPPDEGVPGDCVAIDGHEFHVHGITHAGTPEEGEFLREHVREFLDRGAAVYCEQGVRPLYFQDMDGVCVMDGYRWAMSRSESLDGEATFDSVVENVDALGERIRETAFSLIDSGSDVYGDRFSRTLGDLVSTLLVTHEGLATGDEFESFALTRRAARNPDLLADLQAYYRTAFLPQPVEREWLRRHDPKLELVTHARNERMADYAVYHNDTAEEVHLIVGAAHQPGVVYYLERHRDGDRSVTEFDPA